MMDLDDEICLCFGVTKRKVVNFLKVERPHKPSQLADCFGAGTGCGWCRTFLKQLFEQSRASGENTEVNDPDAGNFPDSKQYAQLRKSYIRETGRQPPPGREP